MTFCFIATNQHPDHDTLANFRKTFLVELKDLFAQVLAYAQTMKLVKLCKISLDGTKIKANTSKHKALSHGHIEKLEAQFRVEIPAMLTKSAETDQQETDDEHDLPTKIIRREQRLQALVDVKAKIAERAARQRSQNTRNRPSSQRSN